MDGGAQSRSVVHDGLLRSRTVWMPDGNISMPPDTTLISLTIATSNLSRRIAYRYWTTADRAARRLSK